MGTFSIPTMSQATVIQITPKFHKSKSFLHSKTLKTNTCAFRSSSNENSSEDGDTEGTKTSKDQKENRKTPRKKISFKVKRNSSVYRRSKSVSTVQKNANSNKVAELTQKFNKLGNTNQEDKESSKNSSHTVKNFRVFRKPSLKIKPSLDNKNIVIIKKLPSINKKHMQAEKKQNSVRKSLNPANTVNTNTNLVKATIEIFEKRSASQSDLKPKPLVKPSKHIKRIASFKETKEAYKQIVLSRAPTNIINNNIIYNSDVDLFNDTIKDNKEIKTEISINNEINNPEKLKTMYEKLHFKNIPKPNSSFLWRDKSPTNAYATIPNRNEVFKEIDTNYDEIKVDDQIKGFKDDVKSQEFSRKLPELPPKQVKSNMSESKNVLIKIVEAVNEKIDQNTLYERLSETKTKIRDTNETIDGYECVLPESDENIYEAMSISSVQMRRTQKDPLPSIKDETESNCYESIYNSDYKKEFDGESIYESIYNYKKSFSKTESLISSEQNTNSLYGKTPWICDDNDSNTYKAISDLSDEWVDVTDNEETQQERPGIIIIREKQRNKKSAWSQQLREQWAKADSTLPLPTTDDDTDHHYESVGAEFYEDHRDVDYDSFETDSESEQSLDKNKMKDSRANINLPEPPNTQYGIIKFAGKHMKKLKRNFSIDISKSLSRMTKRKSKTNLDILGKTDTKLNSNNTTAKSPNTTYQNIDFKPLPPKPSEETEKNKTGFLERMRKSISLSPESALELTSNLNKPRSTFYLTETIDIDNDDKNAKTIEEAVIISNKRGSLSPRPKSALARPQSPPPPIPVLNKDSKKMAKSTSWYEGTRFLRSTNTSERQGAFWYAEIGLYQNQSPDSSASTSTAENSGASNNLETSDFENNDEYYNMKNEKHSDSNGGFYNSLDNSKEDGNRELEIQDIQQLLQEEPLYQFYDAAVLESVCRDGMTQYDCDNYEDVDDESNSQRSSSISTRPSAMELVFPDKNKFSFNRTLWCEIPEVIHSSVLSQLSTRQKKLQEAKFEIITSEASYLNSLIVLMKHFANSLNTCNYLNEKEYNVIFGKISAVKNCSEKLLQDLEKCWQDNVLLYGICDIVQRHAEENFNVYIPYCENQILLGETFKHIRERPGFTEFLKELETNSSCHFLSLYSFLMLPMQRITRWPLLVDAVLKRLSQSDPEYLVCQHALASLNKIVSQCNEAARKKEREIELKKISETLEFGRGVKAVDIISSNRWLLRSGHVTFLQPKHEDTKMTFGKRPNKLPLCLFLFNDLFLVTKEKSDNEHLILHHCPRNLVELNDADGSILIPKKETLAKHLLFLTILENQDGKTVELLLSCNKESDKERWIEAFLPPRSEDPEETLYECWDCPQVMAVHDYDALQPDELSLSRGDVVNVLRKMADGWYHGEKIRDALQGWFPANHTSEIANPHVRARNLRQRYRLLAFSENYLKKN